MRVERELRARLATMEPGEQLPPVADLAAEFGTGHGTVARVLRALADEGLVTIVPRYGAFKAVPGGQPEPGEQE